MMVVIGLHGRRQLFQYCLFRLYGRGVEIFCIIDFGHKRITSGASADMTYLQFPVPVYMFSLNRADTDCRSGAFEHWTQCHSRILPVTHLVETQ